MIGYSRKTPFSVSDVNQNLYEVVRRSPLFNGIWVVGEVSSLNDYSRGGQTGHLFFTLIQKTEARTPAGWRRAGGSSAGRSARETWQLPCVMWRGNRISDGLDFKPEPGMNVLIYGSLDVYRQGGNYRLSAEHMERADLTEGEKEAQKKELIARLSALGWFNEPKKPLPQFVWKIGVASSANGAAVRDIINTVQSRAPWVRILVRDCLVQGSSAPQSVSSGIRALDAAGTDVIIVSRGGGGKEDLDAFNSQEVAAAIHECRTPVISAVGHERDHSISDDMADDFEITPTAAAAAAVRGMEQVPQRLHSAQLSLYTSVRSSVRYAQANMRAMQYQLMDLSPQHRILGLKQRLESIDYKIRTAMPHRIQEKSARCDFLEQKFISLMTDKITDGRHRLEVLEKELDGLDPYRKMQNGFGFVTDDNNRRVCSYRDVAENGKVHIYLADGRIDATVTGTYPKS